MNFELLKTSLIISIVLSSITCTIVQKTKVFLKNSKWITIYSLIINVVTSILFCYTFTDIKLPLNIWIGIFSFLGADSIYRTLEGKISSYTELTNEREITIKKANIINEEDK